MPGTHQKTVTVVPVDDSYGWSVIDDATNSTASWITVTNAQQNGSDTDTWDFTVVDNTNSAARSATCTVAHSNGVVTDFFTIDQAGTGISNTPVGSYTSLAGTPSSIDEDGSTVTFVVTGVLLQDATVSYSLSGTGITSNDVGIGMNGTISIVNNTGSLTVPILADNLTEGPEDLTCTIAGTDSNGISTGGLSTNVTINDTSLNPTYNYSINWDEHADTDAYWMINSTSITGGYANVSNVVSGAQNTSFDGTPGDTIQITLYASANAGRDFETVNSAPVISETNFTPSTFNLISENTSLNSGGLAWPNNISWIVEFTLPNAGTNVTWNAGYNASTIAESTSGIIALHGPLGLIYTCGTSQSVDITASYDDATGTLANPQPAVGTILNGVSPNASANYLVVTGGGSQATSGSAIARVGEIVSILESEVMGYSSCTPQGQGGQGPQGSQGSPGGFQGSPAPNPVSMPNN